MTIFLTQNFDLLKQCVLSVAGLRNITPGDCRVLSSLIFKKTNQQISETTLKRIYGFAYSKFKPSLFTLDAMARFCGQNGWDDFCEINLDTIQATDFKTTTDNSWGKIKRNAEKVTGFTLQVLKNKSVIPYNLTIKRKFIDDHFGEFLKGDLKTALLTAPAGYGKTIALCHWVEERVLKNNDIILFFSSNALINVFLSGKDINQWLLALLGYSDEDNLANLFDSIPAGEGKFYLVIDGLDEHKFKKEQFNLLLSQILDVISLYKNRKNFRLVLTMRSSTWVNNRHEFEDFKEDVFYGFTSGNDLSVNVPLLSVQEIKELAININPEAQGNISVEVAENFNHPLYLQFYYKQNKANFSFDKVNHISIYELVSTFILNKVYLGNISTEKIILIKALTENMDPRGELFEVDKLKINDLITKHNCAYNELLGIGFIRETNKSGDLHYHSVVNFGNNNFLNYCLARMLIYKNDNVVDINVIQDLNDLFVNGRKLQVLKWCIIYAFKNGQHQYLDALPEACLSIKERSELLIFLGDVLKNESSLLPNLESLTGYFRNDTGDALFNYFFGLEFINTEYKNTLKTLLIFEPGVNKKILIYTSLAMIAIVQLDFNSLEQHLSDLKSFSEDELQLLAINPVSCVETIFYYLKYGVIKHEAFIELTKFYFNPPQTAAATTDSSTTDILYLLAVYTISLCNSNHKMLRFTGTLKKIYKKDSTQPQGFHFLVDMMAAEADFLSHKTRERSFTGIEPALAYNDERRSHTPFMAACFHLLKAKLNLHQGKTNDLYESMNLLTHLADKFDFKLLKAQGLAFILKNRCLLNDEAYYKDSYYSFMKLMRESGLREESFIDNATVLDSD